MVTISVSIPKNDATPALRALGDALAPHNLLPVFGRSISNAIRANFDELESSRPNKNNFPRTHYYSRARQGTSYVVDGDRVLIGIRQAPGLRLRLFGGKVQAGANPSSIGGGPTKYLTIPVTAESYGHRAKDFPDLVVLWGASGPYALARQNKSSLVKGIKAGAVEGSKETEVLFILTPEVEIGADRSLLPYPEQIEEAVRRGFGSYVRATWRERRVSEEGSE